MKLKIISGGQTGVDTGAVRAALAEGVPARAYFPRGWKREEPLTPGYEWLKKIGECLTTSDYAARTRHVTNHADAVLVLTGEAETPGTRLTLQLAHRLHKPTWDFANLGNRAYWRAEAHAVAYWLRSAVYPPDGADEVTLMVAGPRGSKWLAGEDTAITIVTDIIKQFKEWK